jgi:hypothetical protein
MVPGLAKLSYEERLVKLGIPSLSCRRFRGNMIEIYKYLHRLYCIYCSDILPLNRSEGAITRGHGLKHTKITSQTVKSNFGFRVANAWNSIPEDIVSASSVNCFKGCLNRLYKGMSCKEVWDINI